MPDTLSPPRYWWLKRLGLAGVLMIVLLVVAHSAALMVTGRKIDALAKSSRDAGQPVLPDDFNASEHLSPERDAAGLYIKAAAAIAAPGSFPAEVNLDRFREVAFIRANLDLAVELVNTNGQTLTLFRQGRELSEADWGIRFTSPMIGILLPMLSPQRALSRFACTAAITKHLQGHDAECVAILRDALHHASMIERPHPILLTHMVAMANTDVVARGVEVVAPRLRLEAPGAGDKPGEAASRRQVRELIGDLLAVEETQEAMRAAIYFERAYVYDAVTCICDGSLPLNTLAALGAGGTAVPFGGPVVRHLMKPLWRMDAAESFRHFTLAAEAHEHDNFVAVMADMPEEREEAIPESPLWRPSTWLIPTLTRQTQLHFRGIAMRRMAAIALALRAYEVDHGRRPESLDDLVPDYLASVLLDPFDGDDGPIRYLPNAEPPLLYSVNIDGIDGGGEYAMGRRSVDPNSLDLVFFLDGNRPYVSRFGTPPAATAAGAMESPQDDQPGEATSQPAGESPPDPS